MITTRAKAMQASQTGLRTPNGFFLFFFFFYTFAFYFFFFFLFVFFILLLVRSDIIRLSLCLYGQHQAPGSHCHSHLNINNTYSTLADTIQYTHEWLNGWVWWYECESYKRRPETGDRCCKKERETKTATEADSFPI